MSTMTNKTSLLRFITCGSVDDGKSTLIGRLLYDTKAISTDQVHTLTQDSLLYATQGQSIDLALLVDGLQAEREQGITIDVAYRYFSTPCRSFIVADCPGHEQYTRNMVTGASVADLAIVLVDATKGILPQTCRHSTIAHLLGIRHIVLAINKMDLVDYDQTIFEAHTQAFATFAARLGIARFSAVPVSGFVGDNVMAPSSNMAWYKGPTLLGLLEAAELDLEKAKDGPTRLPVQRIARGQNGLRLVQGTICSGKLNVGDEVIIMPTSTVCKISALYTGETQSKSAKAGEAVSVALSPDIDCGRGAVIASPQSRAIVADQFEATLIWMNATPLVPGRRYLLKLATQSTPASVSSPKYKYQVETLDHLSATHLALNEIGVVVVTTSVPLLFDPYDQSKAMGGFILVDPNSHETIAAGTISHELRRSQNVHWQTTEVDSQSRSSLMKQKPLVIWFTGLSGSGKSTIASLVEKQLHQMGHFTYLLDGDNLRHGLNRDLGFTAADRVENIRRVGEVAKLMCDAGLIVLAAFISPFEAERAVVRAMMPEGRFVEVFVDAMLETVEARDSKGLYRKARAGLLPNFTGVDMPYERPTKAEIVLETDALGVAESVAQVLAYIETAQATMPIVS
jgi:bifunctional enzyme CysN/CysC